MFSTNQWKIQYAFNPMGGIDFGQRLPHVQEDWTIGLGDPAAYIELLEAALWEQDSIGTAKLNLREILHQNHYLSQYFAEFGVIPDQLDWNPLALGKALTKELSEQMNISLTCSRMPEEVPGIVLVCHMQNIQIPQ
jgi:hypothetical protein